MALRRVVLWPLLARFGLVRIQAMLALPYPVIFLKKVTAKFLNLQAVEAFMREVDIFNVFSFLESFGQCFPHGFLGFEGAVA